MRIGKLGLAINKSRHPDKPLFQIIRIKYFGKRGGEFIIHSLGVFINISWLGSIYKLSTDK